MILTLIIYLRNNNLLCNLIMQILIKYNIIKYVLNLKFEKNYEQLK